MRRALLTLFIVVLISGRIIIRDMRLITALVVAARVREPSRRPDLSAAVSARRHQGVDRQRPRAGLGRHLAKGEHPGMHRHLYDMTGLYYWPGRSPASRPKTAPSGHISTQAGQIQWQLKGITHIEEGTSDDPLRAVMIELKGDGPSDIEREDAWRRGVHGEDDAAARQRARHGVGLHAAVHAPQPSDGYVRGMDRGQRAVTRCSCRQAPCTPTNRSAPRPRRRSSS